MSRLILDADGVFLDERPYWDAALAAAFAINGLESYVDGQWTLLTDVAFVQLGLQRLTKRRGCNSNWDLAAVLSKALANASVQRQIAESLDKRDYEDALQTVARRAELLWDDGEGDDRESNSAERGRDPLLRFGIDRRNAEFSDVRTMFQRALNDGLRPGQDTLKPRLLETRETTRSAFAACRALGYELWVCTGRSRNEIVAPIVELRLEAELSPERIVSHDEIVAVERRTGVAFLGKPHWFPPACAAVGIEEAVALLEGKRPAPDAASCVYVGDALADFQSAAGCRVVGIPMEYVHVRSKATVEVDERLIASCSGTRAVIHRLSELPVCLG